MSNSSSFEFGVAGNTGIAMWGLNPAGLIFRFNSRSTPPAFAEIAGQLAQIATGADGSVWGLNSAGLIFRFNPGATPPAFEQINGQLLQIAVGGDGSVWGLNAAGSIFRFNASSAPPGFEQIVGQLAQIAVGADGAVWGLNPAGRIFRFNPQATPPVFEQITGQLMQIAVGAESAVWGVNPLGFIFRFNPQAKPPAFEQIPGVLAQIAAGGRGEVWGVNPSGLIFRFNPQATPPAFEEVNGQLVQIAVGADSSVWGLNAAGLIFQLNAISGFQPVPGQLALLAGAPASIRTLAAHHAISTHYANLGGPAGRLGASTSAVASTQLSRTFVQNFRGGKLNFDTASGVVSLTDGVQLRISYQGINCFGNPGGVANDDAYGIIQVFGAEQKLLKTTKVPEDGTDDVYKNLEGGQSSTQGQISWVGTAAEAPIPPQTLTMSSTVFHTGILGQNSQSTKNDMAGALGKAAAEFAGLFGLGIASDTAESVGKAIGNAIGDVFSLGDVKINTVNKTFSNLNQLTSLPPSDALTERGITHNFATDIITNGDASYKLYSNIEVLTATPIHTVA